jgi:hypothetical protein
VTVTFLRGRITGLLLHALNILISARTSMTFGWLAWFVVFMFTLDSLFQMHGSFELGCVVIQ